jgi:hypothetical protein
MTTYHPHKNDKGQMVKINHPGQPTALLNWNNPDDIATVVPGGPMPESICGITLWSRTVIPTTATNWERLVESAAFE